jgi:hypothetical protein
MSALSWNTKSNITKMHGQQYIKKVPSLVIHNFNVFNRRSCILLEGLLNSRCLSVRLHIEAPEQLNGFV